MLIKKIIGNRYLYSLLKTVLFSAAFHIFLLVVYAVETKDIQVLNLFSILDIDLFFPHIKQGGINFILSVIVFLFIYLIIFIFTKPVKTDSKQ